MEKLKSILRPFLDTLTAWWYNLSDYEKNVIKSLPNFDAEIFKEITGIDVNISNN